MNDTTGTIEPRLWSEQGFLDNRWRRAESAEELDSEGNFIVPLEVFAALDEAARSALKPRLGVELQPGDDVEALAPHLDGLPLVALAFPAYTDGRSYSKAQLLRSRYAYEGEVRATGDVLFDQVAHMLRVGFSTLEVKNAPTLARLEAGQRGGIGLHYQPAARAASSGAYSWRRQAAG
ncbi:DUF934 domain-containing protein [Nitratireductor thuwali]|uniref:DUF934 domain-containing protein n=1 Tax=Nitratireductor thuwali TaxID=2267699 RepID=A0ABY5MM28_9HYPH|nr:hypothetical protein NTH_02370 [Nitratireductor thuwali]